tara:strand:+ start:836 stop:1294 length:459 start_codon:yes stop_codon:yes gene_type:complete
MSTLFVDTINEKTSGNGIAIPGHVIQVVQGTFSTQTDSSNNGAVATGLSVNITPKHSNSKILVTYNLPLRNGNSSNNYILAYLYRDTSSIGTTGIMKVDSSGVNGHVTAEVLDSPATTSQVTYAAYVNPRGYSAQWCGASTLATITAMEIAQ